MFLSLYTLVHVAISLVGILSGLAVLYGLLTAKRLEGWTKLFLSSTLLTSLTGFGFPVDRFLPSHAVGLVSLLALGLAFHALSRRRLQGSWRWVYVVTAVLALYLNVFVLIVQSFLKVPSLTALAPTQSEPPFQLTQLAALALFLVLGAAAVRSYRPAPSPSARNFG
jgi:hypothetical protein